MSHLPKPILMDSSGGFFTFFRVAAMVWSPIRAAICKGLVPSSPAAAAGTPRLLSTSAECVPQFGGLWRSGVQQGSARPTQCQWSHILTPFVGKPLLTGFQHLTASSEVGVCHQYYQNDTASSCIRWSQYCSKTTNFHDWHPPDSTEYCKATFC